MKYEIGKVYRNGDELVKLHGVSRHIGLRHGDEVVYAVQVSYRVLGGPTWMFHVEHPLYRKLRNETETEREHNRLIATALVSGSAPPVTDPKMVISTEPY